MDSTRVPLAAQLGDEPFAFALDSLIDYLAVVPESRQAQGMRYPLAPLLALAVLAKLAGHPNPCAIASWAKLREADLIPVLHWGRQTGAPPTRCPRSADAASGRAILQIILTGLPQQFCPSSLRSESRLLAYQTEILRSAQHNKFRVTHYSHKHYENG